MSDVKMASEDAESVSKQSETYPIFLSGSDKNTFFDSYRIDYIAY